MNVSKGASISIPIFNSPVQQATTSGFQGFDFSSSPRPSFLPMAYPGLDGHPRRITPIPITPTPGQPSTPAISKPLEQIQREASELIQRLGKEKLFQLNE